MRFLIVLILVLVNAAADAHQAAYPHIHGSDAFTSVLLAVAFVWLVASWARGTLGGSR